MRSSRSCWGTVQEGSRERSRSWNVLHAQCISVLSSGFPISHSNAKTLDRWGGKTKHLLISYFPISTSAKTYRNRIRYVKIIASQRWDVFETRCRTKFREGGWCYFGPAAWKSLPPDLMTFLTPMHSRNGLRVYLLIVLISVSIVRRSWTLRIAHPTNLILNLNLNFHLHIVHKIGWEIVGDARLYSLESSAH